jgi:hypothetical protein
MMRPFELVAGAVIDGQIRLARLDLPRLEALVDGRRAPIIVCDPHGAGDPAVTTVQALGEIRATAILSTGETITATLTTEEAMEAQRAVDERRLDDAIAIVRAAR